MGRHVICRAEALQPGSVLIVEAEKRSIGIFNIHGDFYALRNTCPHKGAPLCRGIITGLVVSGEPLQMQMTRNGEIVRCPWHGWEFDIITGRSVYNPHRMRVKTYDVAVEQMAEDDPSVETYPVQVEEEFVVLYI
ncbi:MAG: Rieske (2Fe-2S) protein [Chloroflexi bacterium]|nr:Rieske (2Fe-2S) protein [Chloroflexota bacterium]